METLFTTLRNTVPTLVDSVDMKADAVCGRRSGVYELRNGDEVVYVGQTGDVGRRCQAHRRDKTFDTVRFYPCRPIVDRLRLEAILVMLHLPTKNRRLNLGLSKGEKVWEIRH